MAESEDSTHRELDPFFQFIPLVPFWCKYHQITLAP